MSFVQRFGANATPARVSLETLKAEAEVGQHRLSGEMGRAGIRADYLDELNKREIDLFYTVISSLVPGIQADLAGARAKVDRAYHNAYGAERDEFNRKIITPQRSEHIMGRIHNSITLYKLDATGLDRL